MIVYFLNFILSSLNFIFKWSVLKQLLISCRGQPSIVYFGSGVPVGEREREMEGSHFDVHKKKQQLFSFQNINTAIQIKNPQTVHFYFLTHSQKKKEKKKVPTTFDQSLS